MTRPELDRRFDALTTALEYSSSRAYYSAGQRTCLHMERAAVMHARAYLTETGEEARDPDYRIPAHLEAKVEQIMKDRRS